MSPAAKKSFAPDTVAQHRNWLALVEVTGPFLSLPVLRSTWPTLDPIDKDDREALRRAHGEWRLDPVAGQQAWIDYVLRDLLGWADDLHRDALDLFSVDVPQNDATIRPSFVLAEPGSVEDEVKPDAARLLGVVCAPGTSPTARIAGDSWAATPVDRLAQLCRHHDVELGLATDGRWWVFVRAPRGGVTSTAVFDSVAWAEGAERDAVRAFRSILGRTRFFRVPDALKLPKLLKDSEANQEDITEALGVQVRQAVELLVAEFGRIDVRERAEGREGLEFVEAHDVYRGAVSVMMRIVFLLFAEERKLLPSDNDLYAAAYSAGRLCEELEQRAREGSENELENSTAAWHRLLALFAAVYEGIDHPRLTMHAHDGSLFNPLDLMWLPTRVDDRTVLHMLRAVQYVEIGSGKTRERRKLSFRQLDVEQIGYVYEGLLSYDGFRAVGAVVSLHGKAGLEPEVPLADLELLGRQFQGRPLLAAELATRYKKQGIGSPAAVTKMLVPLTPAEVPGARKKLLAVTDNDHDFVDRLLPWYRLIRTDLREQPVVIMPGALYITDSPLRRNTGTHYTPRDLAEEVVEHALHPLLFEQENGPLQTPDKSLWKHKTSEQLLELKVADIAMGSAAFLVAAARYLGAALVDAWVREGREEARIQDDTRPLDADEDPVVIEARRQIIEHCLYGVDINRMAVEMAKLSLWLVSMDPKRPFTFLDDRLVSGDSLLGVVSTEQLEYLHLDPKRARELNDGAFDWAPDVRGLIKSAAEKRRAITQIELGDDPIGALEQKRLLLDEIKSDTGLLRLLADLTAGSALAGFAKRAAEDSVALEGVAAAEKAVAGDGMADAILRSRRWLSVDGPEGAPRRRPLHWPLVFPEVFTDGGFDAVVGNPPFLGGTWISGVLGSVYREHLARYTGSGVRAGGRADLVAYFVVQAHRLLRRGGQTGLIATSTLAQGDSREVGIDPLVDTGIIIRRSVKSRSWPTDASVEYCALWTTDVLAADVLRIADGHPVSEIGSSLDSVSRAVGQPYRLLQNAGIASKGMDFGGAGFILTNEDADALVQEDPAAADVVVRLANGRDLNSSPTCEGSRFIVYFRGWPEEVAKRYPGPYDRLRRTVMLERATKSEQVRKAPWWWFWNRRPGLAAAVEKLDRVVVVARVSSTAIPCMVTSDQVFTTDVNVFPISDWAFLALLSSAPHYWWLRARGSSLKADLRYTTSDVFETLPRPGLTPELETLGSRLDTVRREVMLGRQTGLTKTYNLVFDPSVTDADIVELREIHQAIDEATVRAYGWDDLLDTLDHGFHPAGKDLRWTIGPKAQREILDRLLELNHERYAEEVKLGLHDKKKGKPKITAPKPAPEAQDGLF